MMDYEEESRGTLGRLIDVKRNLSIKSRRRHLFQSKYDVSCRRFGGAGRRVVTRRTARSNVFAIPTEGSAGTPTSSIHDPAHDIEGFSAFVQSSLQKVVPL